jgi:hypothetical protein
MTRYMTQQLCVFQKVRQIKSAGFFAITNYLRLVVQVVTPLVFQQRHVVLRRDRS